VKCDRRSRHFSPQYAVAPDTGEPIGLVCSHSYRARQTPAAAYGVRKVEKTIPILPEIT